MYHTAERKKNFLQRMRRRMYSYRFFFLLLFTAFLSVNAKAGINDRLDKPGIKDYPFPNEIITGRVVDSTGNPLDRVSVEVRGKKIGTSTNKDGVFSINAQKGDVLVFSFIGFETQEIIVGDQSQISISLIPIAKSLNDVIVQIGYGTRRRNDVTGAISSLKESDYKNQPIINASSALQGRVAGVAVQSASGTPDGGVKIRIRGANSINTSNDPLYVVDGVAMTANGLNFLNAGDIASMEVLKDASATAVYGSRGANGVILITTKKGTTSSSTITYDAFVSFNNPIKKYKLMDPVTYAKIANLTAGVVVYPNPDSYAGKGTDWQDMIFRNDASTQNHQLSVTGGNEKVKYFISGFAQNQNSTQINSYKKRYGLRANIDAKLNNKLSLSLGLFAQRTNGHNSGGTGLFSTLNWSPALSVYTDSAMQNYRRFSTGNVAPNPYMMVKEALSEYYTNAGLLNGTLTYKITNWLTYTGVAGLDMNMGKSSYLNNNWISQGNMQSGQSVSDNYVTQYSNILTFHKVFNTKHDLTATALYESNKSINSRVAATGAGLSSTTNGYYNLALNSSQSIGSSYASSAQLSYMGRIAYSYNNEFLFTGTVRRDGSSKFQGNNKWGTFPSFGIGWNLLAEPAIKNLKLFSNLKLRGGWGVTGNDRIAAYSTLGLLYQTLYSYGTTNGYVSYVVGNPATPDVKWETSKQTDIGLDAGFWNDRLTLSFDVYSKNTSNLLLQTPIPNYNGGGTLLKNIGKVNNKGIEVSITAAPVENKNFKWSTSLTYSLNKNKVINLGNDSIIYRPNFGGGLFQGRIQAIKVGQPMGAFNLIPWVGIYQQDDPVLGFKAGDNHYLDVSGNNKIGLEDQVISGNATPKMQLGFNNTVSYKNFSLNVYLQGAYGNKILNISYAATAMTSSVVQYPTLAAAANYWSTSNTSSPWAVPGSKTNRNLFESTQFLQDGSYTRLKNISLSYTLPKSVLAKVSPTLTISGQNLLTFTKYKGFDPEAGTGGSDLDAGIDYGSFPTSKSVTVRLNIIF